MPLRRLLHPILLAVLLVGQAMAATPLSAAVPSSRHVDAAGSGLVLAAGDDHDGDQPAGDLRRPVAPLGSYGPRFVAQTGKNCAFASVSMLIDKWTGGRQRPSQARLRWASRVPSSQGVSFAELSRAVGRAVGIDLRYSPGGGDPLTWNGLMTRLSRGGAAVLGGSYSRLPRHYTRWARDFASQGAAKSGHAVYIERYEATRSGGRVWMMDPLASAAGYRGEWISARALRVFAWRNGRGLVTAAATPEPPVLAGYRFSPPQADEWPLAGGKVGLRLPFSTQRGWPKPPELSVVASWQLLVPEPERESLLPSAAGESSTAAAAGSIGALDPAAPDLAPLVIGRSDSGLSDEADDGASEPSFAGEQPVATQSNSARLGLRDGELVGSVRAPDQPGLYRLALVLRGADGRPFPAGEAPALAPVDVQLRGDLAAELNMVPLLEAPVAGSLARLQVEVVNRGAMDWLEEDSITLSADWQSSIGELPGGIAQIELAAGAAGTFTLDTLVPTRVSEATLRVELVDANGVPLAAYGAEPLLIWLRFVPGEDEDRTDSTL